MRLEPNGRGRLARQTKLRRRALLVAGCASLTLLAGVAVASTWPSPADLAPSGVDVASPAGSSVPVTVRGVSPLATLDAKSADVPERGIVAERLAAGPYSYLRVTGAGAPDAWIATLGEGAPVGARIAIRSFGARRDFVSRRLNRTFLRVDFALVSRIEEEEAR